MKFHSVLCALIIVSAAALQAQVCVPDSNPNTGACTTSTGVASQTSVARIPASFLDPANPRVDDYAVVPCTSGTAVASNYRFAIGHVPSPLPDPFVMPTFGPAGVTSMGDFLDLTLVYDSAIQGPFVHALAANSWSYAGFASSGGTGFTWNLSHDVGLYLSFDSVGLPGLRRGTSEPQVRGAGGYHAAVSTVSQTGVKICLQVSPVPQTGVVGIGCANASGLVASLSPNGLPWIGNAAFSLGIASASPTTPVTLFPSLAAASSPLSIGGGCWVYIDLISMTDLLAGGFGPFVQTTDATGQATFMMPVPADPGLAGVEVWFQSALPEPSHPFGAAGTNAVQCVIQ